MPLLEVAHEARKRNDTSFADAAAHLERELARYKVALKKKRGHSPNIQS